MASGSTSLTTTEHAVPDPGAGEKSGGKPQRARRMAQAPEDKLRSLEVDTHTCTHTSLSRVCTLHRPTLRIPCPSRVGGGGACPASEDGQRREGAPGPLPSPPPAEEGDNPLLQLPTPGLGPWELRPGQGGQELVGYLLNTRCGELEAWPALSVWVVTQIVGIPR